jgi:hypothetical protein
MHGESVPAAGGQKAVRLRLKTQTTVVEPGEDPGNLRGQCQGQDWKREAIQDSG